MNSKTTKMLKRLAASKAGYARLKKLWADMSEQDKSNIRKEAKRAES